MTAITHTQRAGALVRLLELEMCRCKRLVFFEHKHSASAQRRPLPRTFRGLRELRVSFGVVGALVPELLLAARPARMTNDADVIVLVETLAASELLKKKLAAYGFERTRLPHRLRHTTGGLTDILPYDESIAPDDRLELQNGFVLNMAGFRHVVPHAVSTRIKDGWHSPLRRWLCTHC